MRFSKLETCCCRVGSAFVCMTLFGASAFAGPEESPKPQRLSLHEVHKVQPPMSGRGAAAAPYSVRMRITGFLARQHAREGNVQRALLEFHSMLCVDDPAWPDNEQGDSMRIARDIEVAQMMSESGFYDHAVRVLQTSFILSRINQDPQAAVIERQMLATAQLAQVKGVAVPLIDLSFAESEELLAQVRGEQQAVANTASQRTEVLPATVETEVSHSPEPTNHVHVHRELARQPNISTYPPEVRESSPSLEQPERRSAGKSRLSRLVPSRWRNKRKAGSEPASKPVTIQQQPLMSPDVSPTYCAECAGHTHAGTNGGVASSNSVRPPANHIPNPFRPTASRITTGSGKPMTELASTNQDSAIASQRKTTASKPGDEFVVEQDIWENPTARTSRRPEVTSANTLREPVKAPNAKGNTTQEMTLTEHQTDSQQPLVNEVTSRSKGEGFGAEIDPQTASESSAPDNTPSELPSQAPTQKQRRQVGVAGQISSPGIFAIEGSSTTLAALFRRTGGQALGTEAQTRIVRTVDVRGSDMDSAEAAKDFYCQRLEVVYPTGKELDTPIYGQEVVIVDGLGQNPIYVAIMPHFILQLPAKAGNPITADQIVEQIRVYWPNIRDCEIGVVRFDQWGRATKVARLQEADSSVESPLQGGDVLYVDGVSLDRAQVLAAAESIAKLGGAKIRRPDSDVQQTKATEE